MPEQRLAKQSEPISQQLRRKTGKRVLLGYLVGLVSIRPPAKRNPPEVREMSLVLAPIVDESEWFWRDWGDSARGRKNRRRRS